MRDQSQSMDIANADSAIGRSAMVRGRPPVLEWLSRRFFDHIRLDDETRDRLVKLPEKGLVVYVMRTRSTIDYLFFNHLFRKVGLPLAQFANGIDVTFFRGFNYWLKTVFRRLTGRISREPSSIEQLQRNIAAKRSALIFLKVRALTAERRANPAFIEKLVAMQRDMEHPILLLPQNILWPPKPPSKRRTWVDIAFGDQEASGAFRKFGHFVRFSRSASVQFAEPIDLRQVVAQHEDWTDARIATKVRRVLQVHLSREAAAIHGPKLKPSATIQREILERRSFQDELKIMGRKLGHPPEVARAKAGKYLREIAAAVNFEVLLVFARCLDILFRRLFRGVELDEEGLRRVKTAAKLNRRAPMVLVPCHKSHVDYMVVSWAFIRNGFAPPHIAAGANLSFFPLGWLFRRSGAFFLRRSFVGHPLYKMAFRHYMWKLVREGYPLEFFIEGGRSRTGKLLPPRLGILSMLLDGLREGEFNDLQFVPIHLTYEKVLETKAYKKELTGGQKTSESVSGVVKASRFLSDRFGQVHVTFEKPVRLSEYLATYGWDAVDEMSPTDFRLLTKKLAYHLMRRIQEATVVTPSALAATVLLSHHRRGLTLSRMRHQAGFLLHALHRRNARLSKALATVTEDALYGREKRGVNDENSMRMLGDTIAPLLDEGMGLLRGLINKIERSSDTILTIPLKQRIELDIYRNGVLSILAPDCIIATAILAADGHVRQQDLINEARRLSRWFRLEFIYATDTSFEDNFSDTLGQFVDEGLVSIDSTGMCHASSPLALDFYRSMILHLVEGYWMAADALRILHDESMDRKTWLNAARERCEVSFLQGDITRAEAASTAILSNALNLFIEEGLVEKKGSADVRRKKSPLTLSPEAGLDEVAFRRDELGKFLIRLHEEVVRVTTIPPKAQAPEESDGADTVNQTEEESPLDDGTGGVEMKLPEHEP